MNEAVLHLNIKDGQSQAVCMPGVQEINEMIHCLRVPADAAGRTLRLHTPAGDAVDISAKEIASIEIPPPHALIPDFMTEAELEQVLAFTLAHAKAFESSATYEKHDRGRRSRVLDGPANGPLAALMQPKLQKLMPELWPQWHMPPMHLGLLECQITAHGDGDFFAIHTDNAPQALAYRRVSYVLYFHRNPKQFTGGHLCLYYTLIDGGPLKCGRLAVDIDPPRNGLVMFPTYICHEVTPIRCASNALTDQRLTLNGWLF